MTPGNSHPPPFSSTPLSTLATTKATESGAEVGPSSDAAAKSGDGVKVGPIPDTPSLNSPRWRTTYASTVKPKLGGGRREPPENENVRSSAFHFDVGSDVLKPCSKKF